jgi:hypothetical protein
MLSPLTPNDKHPKWIIVLKILETIGSRRARKIASKLKVYDIDNFILAIKIIVLSSLFERDISYIVSEINQNSELQKLLDTDSAINPQEIYKLNAALFLTLYQALLLPSHKDSLFNSKLLRLRVWRDQLWISP